MCVCVCACVFVCAHVCVCLCGVCISVYVWYDVGPPLLLTNELGPYALPSLCSMSLSNCVGLEYRHTVLVVKGG